MRDYEGNPGKGSASLMLGECVPSLLSSPAVLHPKKRISVCTPPRCCVKRHGAAEYRRAPLAWLSPTGVVAPHFRELWGEGCLLEARAEVRESRVFGANLVLRRTISAASGRRVCGPRISCATKAIARSP